MSTGSVKDRLQREGVGGQFADLTVSPWLGWQVLQQDHDALQKIMIFILLNFCSSYLQISGKQTLQKINIFWNRKFSQIEKEIIKIEIDELAVITKIIISEKSKLFETEIVFFSKKSQIAKNKFFDAPGFRSIV